MRLFISCLILSLGLIAQTGTRVKLANLQAVAVTGGSLFVVMPTGQVVQAEIGPGLSLQIPQIGRPTLIARVTSPAPAPGVITEKSKLFRVTAPQSAFDVGEAFILESLVVVHNGLEYAEGEDYTVSGNVVTFTNLQAALAGDLVKIRYRI